MKVLKLILSLLFIAFAGILANTLLGAEAGLTIALVTSPIARASTEDIRSLWDFKFKPEVINHLYKKYGKGFTMVHELREAAGRSTVVSTEEVSTQMEDYYHSTIKIASDSLLGATAGAVATFVLHADSLDTDNNYYLREHFSVFSGNVENGIVESRVTDITVTGGGATVTVTIKPYDITKTIGTIAAGTELAVGPSAFAGETGQPDPTTSGLLEHDHYAQIFKETKAFGGPELAKQKWVQVEGIGWFNEELARGEFLLDMQQEVALLLGQENTNSIVQTSSVDGKNLTVRKTKGLWTWIDELGGEMTWDTTAGFDLDDFATVTDFLISQGLTAQAVGIKGGLTAIRGIEAGLTDFVTANSGGTDLTRMLSNEIFGSRTDRMLDYGYTTFKKDGIVFCMKDLALFNNPTLFGVSGYNLKGSAFVVPYSNLKDAKTGFNIPNLQARHYGLGQYSRERVVRILDGMTGFKNVAVNDIDAINAYWLAHVMYVFEEANKAMLIKQVAP